MGRRSGLPEHEAEELRSWALFKLVEDDYRILARWEGRSKLSSYLTVVLVNLMRDYRIHVWGSGDRPRRPAAGRGGGLPRTAPGPGRAFPRGGDPSDAGRKGGLDAGRRPGGSRVEAPATHREVAGRRRGAAPVPGGRTRRGAAGGRRAGAGRDAGSREAPGSPPGASREGPPA